MLTIPVVILLGHSVVALNGPWKFQTGDNSHWAETAFDDSAWAAVDLTPKAGSHDPDVGLPGYVPGWTARGYAGYSGYAWYRLRVAIDAPAGDTIALSAPTDVDDSYELFVNGVRLARGGAPYSLQPRMVVLPPGPSATIAIRAWVSRASVTASPGDAGGIHVAPAIGEVGAIRDRYRLQWQQTIWGYIVDGIEPVLFLALAAMALALRQPWMAAALVVTSLLRINQVVFFWLQIEPAAVAEAVVFLVPPLMIGVWIMAWRSWLGLRWPSWIPIGIVSVLAIFWSPLRVLLAAIMVAILVAGRRRWASVVAAALVSIGLFAPELSALHIPGIWFPFGVGVSRTQYAYAAFDVAVFALFVWTISSSLPATSRSTS
jgi:hypothetical protein